MEIIEKYFELSTKKTEQFALLQELYADWNSKINVISRKDIDSLYEKHILHSLAIAKLIRFRDGAEVIDVGTGGGFPGIPLAIYFPQVRFHLIDSIGKKIKVVNAVAEALGLQNVTAQQIRSNELRKRKFEFVVSRAVTNLPKFVDETRHLISTKDQHGLPNGTVYLKGGDLTEELDPFKKVVDSFNISDFFEEDFFDTKKIIYLPR